MRTNIVGAAADAPFATLRRSLHVDPERGPQRLYPVVDASRRAGRRGHARSICSSIVDAAHGERSRALVVDRPQRRRSSRIPTSRCAWSCTGWPRPALTRFPVVERGPARRLVGMIALDDLLKARALNLEAEQRRERVLRVRFPTFRKA